MKIWKQILLAIFSLGLIFNLSLVVYLQTVQKTALNPAFLQGELDELNFYPLVKENLLSLVSREGYSDEKFQEILDKAITESWLRTQTNSLIDSLLNYLNSETEELALEVSSREVKENLKENTELPLLLIDTIPDKFDILQNLGEKDQLEFKKSMSELRKYISYFHLAFYLLIALTIILILLIVLLARELKSIFRRLGVSFFISGSSLYLGNFLTLRMVAEQFPATRFPSFLPKELFMKLLHDFLEPINFWGVVFMVAGIIMIVWSFLLRAEKKKEIEEGKL